MANSNVKRYEEHNWAVIVICLKRSAAVLRKPVEDTLRKEFDSWDDGTKNDFRRFTQDLKSDDISVRYISYKDRKGRNIQDTWEVNDSYGHKTFRHKNILNKILSIHSNPQNIQWDSDKESYSTEPFWILAKIFMPYGSSSVSTPGEADPISLFDLVKNCQLFKSMFDLGVIEELCTARNAVMHSCDQRLSSMEKNHYIKQTEAFLDSACFRGIPEVIEMKRILTATKYRYIHLEPVAVDMIEKEVQQMFPDRHFTTEELFKETSNLFEYYVSSGIHHLKQELVKDTRKLTEQEAAVERYKAIGGITGASVVGGTSLAAVGAVALIVSAPIAVPVVIAGSVVTGVATGIGFIGGRAGGAVIGLFRKITQ